MSIILEKYTVKELKKIAEELSLKSREKLKTKSELIQSIKKAFQEYEEYKAEKLDKYTKHTKLGEGKEGTTFLVIDRKNREYAMKTFRKTKSSTTLTLEYELQKKAARKGVAPKPIDYDTVSKYIVMEKMDEHFFTLKRKSVTKEQQKRLLEIFEKLDKAGVFHNDINLMNFMLKNGTIFLIDYGFAKEITPKLVKKLKTETPNSKLMTVGLIIKMKEINFPESSYKYLLKTIMPEDRLKYKL